ncbi:MAG: hypothetical protein FJZ58_01720 [Chlamydiae bacterium]|nr:hypothetical protein [Chlamydiota bacterium]
MNRSFHLSAEDFERVNQEKHLALQQGKADEEFWVSYAKKKEIRLSEDWTTSFRIVMKEAVGVNSKMYSLVGQLKQRQTSVALLSIRRKISMSFLPGKEEVCGQGKNSKEETSLRMQATKSGLNEVRFPLISP